MSDALEKVARAICEEDGQNPDHKEPGDDAYQDNSCVHDGVRANGEPYFLFWRRYVDHARAAIKAIREPTPEMIESVVRYPAELVAERNDANYTRQMQAATAADGAAAANMFTRMIDAILKDTPDE